MPGLMHKRRVLVMMAGNASNKNNSFFDVAGFCKQEKIKAKAEG